MTASPAEPFDRSLPSPIAAIAALRASSREAVVAGEELSPAQRRMFVATGLEERLLGAARSDHPPALIVISGSAGGGKSALIRAVLAADREAFGAVVEDATHSDSPAQDQVDRLLDFLAPFADGRPVPAGRPRLLAMNTGMVLNFFAAARQRETEIRLSELEALLKARLRIPTRPAPPRLLERLDPAVLVVNLDHRPTAGADGSLFRAMLAALDPADPSGVLAGAQRCATCQVVAWCPVRANAQLASSPTTVGVLDAATGTIALQRGRELPPRALWDLAAELVLGGADPAAGPGDPCDTVAERARQADTGRVAVWDGLLCNGAFERPQGELMRQLAELDPTFQPDSDTHDLIAETGIRPQHDAAQLLRWLGAGPGERPAVESAAAALAAGVDATGQPVQGGRGLARAAWLAGALPAPEWIPGLFRDALASCGSPGGDPEPIIKVLETVVEPGLVRGLGEEVGAEKFFHTDAPDAGREVSVMVATDLLGDDLLTIGPDPVLAANERGSRLAGYRPLVVWISLAGMQLPLDLPLFSLLQRAEAGAAPSTVDLERFHALRRALEAVGRRAAEHLERPLLVSDRRSRQRFRAAPLQIAGRDILRIYEVM